MARRSGVDGCRCLPLPGQQVVELVSLGPSGDDAFEDILEVGERLDGMELGGVDQAGCDRPMPGTAIRAGE